MVPAIIFVLCVFSHHHLLRCVTSVMFIVLRRVVSVVRELHPGRVQRGLHLHLLRSTGRLVLIPLRQTRAVLWPCALLCAW